MEEGTCQVIVLEHTRGILQGCKVCRQIILRGTFAIGILVRENGKDFKYLLGSSIEEHCGEKKAFFECFDTAEEAEAKRLEVFNTINEKGSTEGLPLRAFLDPSRN